MGIFEDEDFAVSFSFFASKVLWEVKTTWLFSSPEMLLRGGVDSLPQRVFAAQARGAPLHSLEVSFS